MFWTGMRFNEGLGLSLADIYKGEITRDSFKNLLRRNLIFHKDSPNIPEDHLYRYFGFITLASQPDNDGSKSIIRNENEQVLRKPLKMKKGINERRTRLYAGRTKIQNQRINQTIYYLKKYHKPHQCLGSNKDLKNLTFCIGRGTVVGTVEGHSFMERQGIKN